jgi:hypothetical protein
VHIDDEFWPEEGEAPKEKSGAIEVRIEDAAVEFLVTLPQGKKQD